MNQYLRRAIKTVDFWLEWSSTAALIISVAFTNWQITPWNMWLGFAANAVWIYLAIKWNRWSLAIISVVISGLYVAGLIRYY